MYYVAVSWNVAVATAACCLLVGCLLACCLFRQIGPFAYGHSHFCSTDDEFRELGNWHANSMIDGRSNGRMDS